MVRKEIPDQPLPDYHERLLIMRLHADVRSVAVAAHAAFMAAPSFAMAGERSEGSTLVQEVAPALAALARAGAVRRVVSLARPSTTGFATMTAAIAASFSETSSRGRRLLAGTTLVELEPGVDVSQARQRLAEDAQVQFVSRVPVRYLAVKASRGKSAEGGPAIAAAVPPQQSSMWNLKKIEWAEARGAATFTDATTIKVGVLDTGVDRNHPDLVDRVSDYTFQHPDEATVSGEKDLIGHGTHVTGTIAANLANGFGIGGICTCDLRVWKIFTDRPTYVAAYDQFMYVVNPEMYHRALADCADEDIDVINLSIGGPAPPDAQELLLFNALTAAGTVVCAAMGNERAFGSPTSYPAAIQDVVAVGATSINDTVASFSNRGDHISLCAPGKGIWSTLPTYDGQSGFGAVHVSGGVVKEGKPIRRERDYDSLDGTSMACPHVTGAAALLLAKTGRTGPAAVKDLLQKRADRVAGMGTATFHPDYGAGRLNLRKLLV